MIKDGMTEIVIALRKGTPGIDQTLVVGELADSTELELVLKKAVSPSLNSETADLVFHQHLIPTIMMDVEYADNILTVLRKDALVLYAILDSNDPHPLCIKYKEFWEFPTSYEAGQPDPEELEPQSQENQQS